MKRHPIKLSVILATYNEHKNIQKLVPRVIKALNRRCTYEIIVVDDNSPDGTAKAVRNMMKKYPHLRLILRTKNRGLSNSLIDGFKSARGRYIAQLDSDLCHDPKALPTMIRMLDLKEADMVIGSRYVKGSSFSGKPFIKESASKAAQFIAKAILGVSVKDTTNNFRVFRSEVFDTIKSNLRTTGNIMLTEMVYQTEKHGFRIKEIPTRYVEQREDQTKIRLGKETAKFMINVVRIRMGR